MEIGQGYDNIWSPGKILIDQIIMLMASCTEGMAVPMLSLDYDSWLHPYSEPLVLLQNPSSVDIGRQVIDRTESKGAIR